MKVLYGAILALSVVTNLFFVFGAKRVEGTGQADSYSSANRVQESASSAGQTCQTNVVNLSLAIERCETNLGACRKQSWRYALGQIESQARADLVKEKAAPELQASGYAQYPMRPQHTLCELGRVHVENRLFENMDAIEEALQPVHSLEFETRRIQYCAIVKQHLRRHWQKEKINIDKIIRSMADETTRANWLEDQIREISKILRLNDAERKRLQLQFEKTAGPHLKQVAHLASASDVDYEALLALVQDLHADENSLMLELYGPDSLRHFQEAKNMGRVSLLAMLGQYAGKPWTASTIWSAE